MVQDLSCDPNSDDGKTRFLASQSPLQQILFIITGIIVIVIVIIIIIIVINIVIIVSSSYTLPPHHHDYVKTFVTTRKSVRNLNEHLF